MKNKFLAIVFFVTVLISFNGHASYKSEMPGATQSEREIRWLWKYLNEFLYSCRNSTNECQDPKIKNSLDDLLAYVPESNTAQAEKWEKLLQFVSEKERPDLFTTTDIETHRMAVTTLEKYSVVYINTDRMNLSLDVWAGLLAHEALHHLGIPDGADRYPDQLGVEITKHFKRQMQTSSLEQFKKPDIHTMAFNSAGEGRSTVGFLSTGIITSDIGWESSVVQPFCKTSEIIAKQFTSSPSWRLNRIQPEKGIVTVRGGGYISIVCLNKTTANRRSIEIPLDASIALQYPLPFDRENWIAQTPTPVKSQEDAYGPSNTPSDFKFSKAQTFFIQSVQHEKEQIVAGSTWNTQIILKSVDDFQPLQCQLFVVGTQYSYIGQDHLPGVNPFDSCEFKSLGDRLWQVTGKTVIPASARPDQYYIPIVVFRGASGQGERTAIPTLPKYIKVLNPAAPKISGIEIMNLPAATRLGTLPLTNSYKVDGGQSFKVQFTVEGPQKAFDLWLDVDLWYLMPTEFGIARGTGSSQSWGGVLVDTQVTPIANGTKIEMTYVMPTNVSGLEITAIKFRKFYLRTSDFSWVEVDIPDLHDHLVINKKFGQ